MSGMNERYKSKKQMMKHERGEGPKQRGKEKAMSKMSSKDYSSKRKAC
jgi:hypothetical protein